MEKAILFNAFGEISSWFSISSGNFSKFNPGKIILFQIKTVAGKIDWSTLAAYFIKLTGRSSFIQLRIIKQINKIH